MNIYRNVATGTYADGGGLFIHDSTVRITDCRIDKNEAEIMKLHDRDRYGKIKRETSDQRSRGAAEPSVAEGESLRRAEAEAAPAAS